MKVLGVDPGPHLCGWMAIVRGARGEAMRYSAHGAIDSRRDAFVELLDEVQPDAVAIERPKWHNDSDRNAVAMRAIASNLIETSYVVARFAEIAVTEYGLKLLEIPAQTWRLGVIGSRSPSDAQIKRALTALLRGLPKVTNAHNRDGGGVAIAAARVIGTHAEGGYVATF